MINYEEFFLDNGLRVIVHEDRSVPIVSLNILYKVGSRDEDPDHTGFAHLFEHLMFGGSKNVPLFDEPLQKVGGENNAFTNTDITNYYITLPSINLETAFWLESDRMAGLAFTENSLAVQRKVVVEEFNQRYLNQPYGDAWLKLRPLAYSTHPYRWPTIGKDVKHIENTTIEEVKSFFHRYYIPNNAIMSVTGDIQIRQIKTLAEKWFGPIPAGLSYNRNLPTEPRQVEKRTLHAESEVPLDSIYMAWHMCDRVDKQFHATDLLSDILGNGYSSRLYQQLVKKMKIFNSINAYITGSVDPGLLVISGKLNNGVDFPAAEQGVQEEIIKIKENGIGEAELNKVKNQSVMNLEFGKVEILNRAINLCYFANLGNPELINQEKEKIKNVTIKDINTVSEEILCDSNLSILYYHSRQ